jgi:flavodoxin
MKQGSETSASPDDRRQFLLASGSVILAIAVGGVVAGPTRALAAPATGTFRGRRVLIIYYSRTGHTRTVARMIHALAGGDVAEIRTVNPYPGDYAALVAQNAEEQRADYKPPLKTAIDNVKSYDVVFIGSPIWNVRLTPPVRSFLSSHDLSGRVIAPFVTYKVSGLGRSRRDIEELCPKSAIADGLAVLDNNAGRAKTMVSKWLEDAIAVSSPTTPVTR